MMTPEEMNHKMLKQILLNQSVLLRGTAFTLKDSYCGINEVAKDSSLRTLELLSEVSN